jgi:hypothetical protein
MLMSADIASIIGNLSAPYLANDLAVLDEQEAECLAGYDRWESEGRHVKALSRVRTFAMTVPMHRGFALVMRGDAGGWREIERWWLLESIASHWIGAHIASGAHVLLAYALALSEDAPAEWLATDLRARMAKYPDAYAPASLPRFADHLQRAYAPGSKAGPGAIPELGPYADVFAAWDDPARLSGAIAAVCDHRLQTVASERADDLPEFGFAPLLPVDVAAIATIRRRRGEVMPDVDHPLLRTPLAAIPTTRTYEPEGDPWFRRAVDAAVAEGRAPADFEW